MISKPYLNSSWFSTCCVCVVLLHVQAHVATQPSGQRALSSLTEFSWLMVALCMSNGHRCQFPFSLDCCEAICRERIPNFPDAFGCRGLYFADIRVQFLAVIYTEIRVSSEQKKKETNKGKTWIWAEEIACSEQCIKVTRQSSVGEPKSGDPRGSVVNLPGLIAEFQTDDRLCSKRTRWIAPEE